MASAPAREKIRNGITTQSHVSDEASIDLFSSFWIHTEREHVCFSPWTDFPFFYYYKKKTNNASSVIVYSAYVSKYNKYYRPESFFCYGLYRQHQRKWIRHQIYFVEMNRKQTAKQTKTNFMYTRDKQILCTTHAGLHDKKNVNDKKNDA